jgi:hypothetical protein
MAVSDPGVAFPIFIFIPFRTTTRTTTQGCYCQMIVPILLRGSIDVRHFLGEGRVGGVNLTCMLYFLLVCRFFCSL